MKYAVEITKYGRPEVHPDLGKKEAVLMATTEAERGATVFVSWFRKSDGQHGYLNRDGNHTITGKAW